MKAVLYFIVIYGTRGITSRVGAGRFNCPRCGESPYAHSVVRRWFTLFFIPLIPLNVAGDYVECQRCFGTYGARVLTYDPAAEAAPAPAAAPAPGPSLSNLPGQAH